MAQNTKQKKDKKMSALTAGAIGAGIGALAGAAAVALSDEGTRKKLGKKLTQIEEKVKDAAVDTQRRVMSLEADAMKKLKTPATKKKSK